MSSVYDSGRPVPLSVKLGFGVGDLGGNLFFTMMGFYLLFYLTDTVGMRAGLAGTALMIGKAWDAVTDPAVGYISDRSSTRWGRRRPYMAAGAITTAIMMAIMFTIPGLANHWLLFVYVALVYCLLNTAYTLFLIPYGALTPEITEDFHQRTVLNGYRMSFAVIGTFCGAILVLPIVSLFGGGTRGWTASGLIMGLIMAASFLITVASVREAARRPISETGHVLRAYWDVLRMKPFLTVLIPWTCHITGVNILQASMLYYFGAIFGDAGGFQIALPVLLASSMLFIPVWVRISRRIGKKLSYNIGMGIFTITVLAFFGLGHILGLQFAVVLMGLAGVGFATQYVMPFAIIPDVVEYDYAENGVRREGVFYGLWTFVSKIGQALGIALSGWVLTWFGYQETVAGLPAPVQTELAQFGIRLLIGPIPAAFFIAGIAVLSYYPINAARYAEILKRIHARNAR